MSLVTRQRPFGLFPVLAVRDLQLPRDAAASLPRATTHAGRRRATVVAFFLPFVTARFGRRTPAGLHSVRGRPQKAFSKPQSPSPKPKRPTSPMSEPGEDSTPFGRHRVGRQRIRPDSVRPQSGAAPSGKRTGARPLAAVLGFAFPLPETLRSTHSATHPSRHQHPTLLPSLQLFDTTQHSECVWHQCGASTTEQPVLGGTRRDKRTRSIPLVCRHFRWFLNCIR